MCGRFTLTADGQLVQMALGLEMAPADLTPRYNVAPSQPVGVVTNTEPKTLNFYKWGLIPGWAKDPAIANKLINARSETAHEKPSFKAAMSQRRCLIPADGFYEWQVRGKQKTPMYIFIEGHKVFAFAGLWESWHSPEGEDVHTCTILTTDANDRLEEIHHRMPVILHPDDYDTWLQADDLNVVRSLLKPYDSAPMDAYPVSPRVNKPEHDSPENIKPMPQGDTGQQMSLF